jgi:hypothetical protein
MLGASWWGMSVTCRIWGVSLLGGRFRLLGAWANTRGGLMPLRLVGSCPNKISRLPILIKMSLVSQPTLITLIKLIKVSLNWSNDLIFYNIFTINFKL